jgi:predicted HAD superfamily phosphohydrolase YqeG
VPTLPIVKIHISSICENIKEMEFNQPFNIYVDVDDTLVRSYSSKRIPILATINHVKELKKQGATLYCWSSGGAEYAQQTAEELGIADLFIAFLPKPQMLLDDQNVIDWRNLIQVHPMSCDSNSLDDYQQQLHNKQQ